MSDNGEVEVENTSGYSVLPKDVTNEIGSIKLFNKWAYEDVEIRDISLTYEYLFFFYAQNIQVEGGMLQIGVKLKMEEFGGETDP
jgi:hypothetical protein